MVRDRKGGRVGAVAALCVLAMLVGASVAAAEGGRYHVYSCRMPNGQPAPTDGWSPSTSGSAVYAEDKCSKGGALVAALGDGVAHEVGTDIATWTFSTPSGETLSKANLWRAGDAEGTAAQNATYEFWIAGPTEPKAFSECVYISGCITEVGEPSEPVSTSNLVPVPSGNLGEHLYTNASCGGLTTYRCPSNKGDANGYAAVVYLYAADLVIEQSSSPTITPNSISGELDTASTVSGKPTLLFEAKDSGSGIYQAIVTVDEKLVGTTSLDSNGGHCVNVGQTTDGLPAFLYLQPCASSVSADVPLDTTALTNGSHHLVVSVANAAGDSTVVIDRVITVANPVSSSGSVTSSVTSSSSVPNTSSSPIFSSQSSSTPRTQTPNGTNATSLASLSARWATSSNPVLRSRYGRVQTVRGRLLAPNGAPIAGALIEASMTPSDQGAHSAALTSVRTAGDGTFRLRLPKAAPSSTIAIAYRATLSSPVPSALASLRLVIPATLRLRVSPRVSHVHGTIHFSGVLRGAPIPPGGKQLVLQAFSPGAGWRTFEAISTDRRGRFHATYRFRLPGPVTYSFRALSPAEADFPFAVGSSNVVRVRER